MGVYIISKPRPKLKATHLVKVAFIPSHMVLNLLLVDLLLIRYTLDSFIREVLLGVDKVQVI